VPTACRRPWMTLAAWPAVCQPAPRQSPAGRPPPIARPSRIPIRAPAVAATDHGRRARERRPASGCAKRVMARRPGSRKSSPGRTSAWLRVGIPAKWPLADRPRANRGRGTLRPPRIPIRTPAVAATDAGGGMRDGRRHRAARSALWPRDPADFGYPVVIPRRTCATCVLAARRRSGEVAARRRSWMTAPSALRASPSARRRSRRRAAGAGTARE
jgi:hypothetical protein